MEIGFVLLNCDLGAEEYLLEEIKQVPEVKQAYLTFGAYDIIIEIHAKSADEFDKTVSSKIRRLSRVMSTMTLKVLSTAEKH
ncbi:MAG TPA: Lrp/AsnC ligand binding domain-containing protein [Candidatus Nitrosotenuis sp.]|jgi:DNA-binding Lrp family transcriptional regulator